MLNISNRLYFELGFLGGTFILFFLRGNFVEERFGRLGRLGKYFLRFFFSFGWAFERVFGRGRKIILWYPLYFFFNIYYIYNE